MKEYDLCISGGGAAGLCALIGAARKRPGIKAAVFEGAPRLGKKILVTGNGRCNLTNLNASALCYSSPEFVKPCFDKYPPEKVVEFFESLGLLTKPDGEDRVYPRSNTAASVLDALRLTAAETGADIFTDTVVKSVQKREDGFVINGEVFCKNLIIACGGKAQPSSGKNTGGYDIARSLGHTVTRLYPSLVPLAVKPEDVKGLKGIRAPGVELTLTVGEKSVKSRGELLFTESGISGICAMELAASAEKALAENKKAVVKCDFLPEMSEQELKAYVSSLAEIKKGRPLDDLLTGVLAKQLGIAVCKKAGVYSGSAVISDLSEEKLEKLIGALKRYDFTVTGTKGFDSAQVTSGGVAAGEINPDTLESEICKGLYFAGEIIDVDGPCGGYNLQWAFASGLMAGELN